MISSTSMHRGAPCTTVHHDLCAPAPWCITVTTEVARDKTDQDLTSHGGVLGLGLWAQSAADVRPPRAPASAPDTAAAGKDPWIRRAVTGELPEPHAPSALLELSSLDPGLGARAQDERRAASIARGSRRTRSEKRSGWGTTPVLVISSVSSRRV